MHETEAKSERVGEVRYSNEADMSLHEGNDEQEPPMQVRNPEMLNVEEVTK